MREDISFLSDGRKLVGHLYLPDTDGAVDPLPAVVVIGASSGTKEQTPAVYGARLAQRGFAALSFDHTSYGQS